MRDEFPLRVRETLARRVGMRCSNPQCRCSTTGPSSESTKALNLGVAAHITAASQGGPRFDSELSSSQRQDIENGIWLCQSCASLVDRDTQTYAVELLRGWKLSAEARALSELVMPTLDRQRMEEPTLVLTELRMHYPPGQRAYFFTFSIANTGDGIGLVDSLSLHVLAAKPINLLEAPREGAMLKVFDLEVHLEPGVDSYQLSQEYFVYHANEIDGFSLKITGRDGFTYDIQVRAHWHSIDSITQGTLVSTTHTVTFYAHTAEAMQACLHRVSSS